MKAAAIALVAILLIPPAWATQTEDSDMTFLSLRELRVDREYRLTGYEKDLLREEIDEAGDGDGTVEAFEIDEWREWKARQMTGRESTEHVLDGATGRVVAWDAVTTDATGRYDDPVNNDPDEDDAPLTVRIRETIIFDVDDDGTHTYWLPSPSEDSSFTFEAPPGHSIVSSRGLSNDVLGQDGREVRGGATIGSSIRVDFQRAGEVIGLPSMQDLVGPDAKLGGTTTELEWTDDVRVAHYTLSSQVSGLDAVGLRGLIDAAGNGDGLVTVDEADDVLDRFIRSRLGTPSAMFVMGGAPGTIGSIQIDVQGIAGPVGTQNAISIETTGVIAFDVPARATELSLVITKTAPNARLSLELPDGYSFDSTDGLRGVSYGDGDRTLAADEVDDGSIRMSFSEAFSFGGFHWGQWVSVILGLLGFVGVIVFLAITDRKLSKMTRAVQELEEIQRHHVHGPQKGRPLREKP